MDQNILIEYIEGVADAATRAKVEEWIKADEANLLSFARFKTRYLAANFPYEEAPAEQMFTADKSPAGSRSVYPLNILESGPSSRRIHCSCQFKYQSVISRPIYRSDPRRVLGWRGIF